MRRDEEWLASTVRKCVTLQEAQLAVSVFLAERAQLPLRVPQGAVALRIVTEQQPKGA